MPAIAPKISQFPSVNRTVASLFRTSLFGYHSSGSDKGLCLWSEILWDFRLGKMCTMPYRKVSLATLFA